jgi:ligand-binding sensor protein
LLEQYAQADPKKVAVAIYLMDILNLPVLQAMLDSLWRANGISLGLLDARGEVLISTGWQKLCTDYHLTNPEIKDRCILNHLALPTEDAGDGQTDAPREFICSSGLIDIAMPIWC